MERFLVAFRYGNVSVWVKRVGEGRGEMYLQSLLLGGGAMGGWMMMMIQRVYRISYKNSILPPLIPNTYLSLWLLRRRAPRPKLRRKDTPYHTVQIPSLTVATNKTTAHKKIPPQQSTHRKKPPSTNQPNHREPATSTQIPSPRSRSVCPRIHFVCPTAV